MQWYIGEIVVKRLKSGCLRILNLWPKFGLDLCCSYTCVICSVLYEIAINAQTPGMMFFFCLPRGHSSSTPAQIDQFFPSSFSFCIRKIRNLYEVLAFHWTPPRTPWKNVLLEWPLITFPHSAQSTCLTMGIGFSEDLMGVFVPTRSRYGSCSTILANGWEGWNCRQNRQEFERNRRNL